MRRALLGPNARRPPATLQDPQPRPLPRVSPNRTGMLKEHGRSEMPPAPCAAHGNALPARPARRRRCYSSTYPRGKPARSKVSRDDRSCHILAESGAKVKRGLENDEVCPHRISTVPARGRARAETRWIGRSTLIPVAPAARLIPGGWAPGDVSFLSAGGPIPNRRRGRGRNERRSKGRRARAVAGRQGSG